MASQRSKKNKSHRRRNTLIAVLLSLLALCSAFLTFAPAMRLPFSVPDWDAVFTWAGLRDRTQAVQAPLSVHILDVGQGDAILIKTGDSAALIDAGENGHAPYILSYLKEIGIEKLDYVIATHPHSDHIGSMAQVIRTVAVTNVVMPALSKQNTPTTKTYLDFLQAVRDSGAQVTESEPGKQLALGQAQLTLLSPFEQSENLNNMSVVVRLTFQERSFLFTGDAEKPLEDQILSHQEAVGADVLKLGHHGSNTATGEMFFAAISPKVAVISCGKENAYGHPHKETLALLEQNGVAGLRTDSAGTIVFLTDGKELRYVLEKGKGGVIL